MRTLLVLCLSACTASKEPVDSGSPADTGSPDTQDSVPLDSAETGDSGPTETAETAETAIPIVDVDADGVSPDDGDCDDTDPLVYPGAVDALCDGVDADCDGVGVDDIVIIGT